MTLLHSLLPTVVLAEKQVHSNTMGELHSLASRSAFKKHISGSTNKNFTAQDREEAVGVRAASTSEVDEWHIGGHLEFNPPLVPMRWLFRAVFCSRIVFF